MLVKIFFCYAHEDEPLLKELEKHLRILKRHGLITTWYDRDISAGREWEQEISKHLDDANIILLLVSPDFMDSDYCYGKEMQRALERHERGEARVVPIIVRPVYWEGAPFSRLQILPTDAKPITLWINRDEAFWDVARGIRKTIGELAVSAEASLKLEESQIVPSTTDTKRNLQQAETKRKRQTRKPIQSQVHNVDERPQQIVKADWSVAPHVGNFYGRYEELSTLIEWIVQDHCQVVAIVGAKGIGKTSLVANLAEKIQNEFEFVFWRSHQNAPPLEILLRECILFLSNDMHIDVPKDVNEQITWLKKYFQTHRCLVVLDNFESVLLPGKNANQYLDGYEKYGNLISLLGETRHQSCLLLMSREKPRELQHIEGKGSHVHSMRLEGVKKEDARLILEEKELQGTDEEWEQLIDLYSGNPLVLKLVAESIRVLFDGAIGAFLSTGETVFGGIHQLLNEQFLRLSSLESTIMYWMAIERERVSLVELEKDLIYPVSKRELLEAVEALLQRSMIEAREGSFTLQPVIMEYVTDRFVEEVYAEIEQGKASEGLFYRHALMKARGKDFIRDYQEKLILKPIADRLLAIHEQSGSEKKLKEMLESLRKRKIPAFPGYAAGNILNLLVYLNLDLRGYDFSHLPVRQAYLQGVLLHDVNFTGADLSESVFTDTFSSIFSVALSSDGKSLAAGTANGEIRLWNTANVMPMRTLRGHTEWIRSVTFSPKENILASGSEDQSVRLWDVSTGECLSVLRGHTSRVYSVAFSPDGKIVASGSDDQTIRLWDVVTGEYLKTLPGYNGRVYSVTFDPKGYSIASGSEDGTIRIWDVSSGECFKILNGHTDRVRSVAFSPDGNIVASGSEDQSVRIWDARTGQCLKSLHGHSDRIWSVAFGPDGRTIASGSDDQSIRIWDASTGECLQNLQKQSGRVHSVAFGPDGSTIASGSDGQVVRLWDVVTGKCLRTLQGHGSKIYSVSFSLDGRTIASGSEDQIVRLWDVSTGECLKTLHGHTHWVWSAVFGLKGFIIASGSEDKTVRLWNVRTGECFRILRGHGHRIFSVAFSPDERSVASSSGDQTIKLWDVSTGECLKTLQGHESKRIYSVAFSPDGTMIASGSDDKTIKFWDVSTGECLKTLQGHTDQVRSVAFSPDGTMIASGSDDKTIKLWDVSTGECLKTLLGHSHWIYSIAFSSNGEAIASGSEDQTLRLWDVGTGECLKIQKDHGRKIYSVDYSPEGDTIATGHQDGIIQLWSMKDGESQKTLRSDRPYERMNIADVEGLSASQKSTLKALGAIE